jgi:hypothetical protein
MVPPLTLHQQGTVVFRGGTTPIAPLQTARGGQVKNQT